MRGQQWLFSGKTKIQEKNKPISKKPKDQGK